MRTCRQAVVWAAIALSVTGLSARQLGAQGTSVRPGFRVTLDPPHSGSEVHATISKWLETTQMLERVAAMMNQAFRWPAEVMLTAGECGQSNATYERLPGGGTIRVCYEFVQEIVKEFQHQDLTAIDRGMAQSGTLMFVLLHDVGHALVDQFQLPVEAGEEAADQFATLILSAGDPMAAYWATEYWRRGGSAESFAQNDVFSSAHGIAADRLYNVLCWVYGADPAGRAELIRGNGFPDQRAPRCASEYRRLAAAWEKLLSPLAAPPPIASR
jgi:hypothetical protein